MTRNIGTLDRGLRIVIGAALVAFAIFAPQTDYAAWANWGWIGLVPLATAALGWCPPYSLLGINTCGR
ncbi:MAG: DUF2892 domain-containing protein [Hyphomicrobiaceae bacterium]|nr:DUF2892 domain-containing protein [Hyphomicrobiaceae bacterium]